MLKASKKDRGTIVNILVSSFKGNASVNHIIGRHGKKSARLKRLMKYSFDTCNMFGDVFFSDDKTGCALLIYPEKKRVTLRSILLDAKFILTTLGILNIKKAISRESKINNAHPDGPLYYLWYIGVEPHDQNKGVGSKLMNDLIAEATKYNRVICLETSTLKNIPWYEKLGFSIYKELDMGYKLFCMKKD